MRLQFVLGSDVSSRLISWWGQGYGGFSHVDAVLSDGTLLGARSDKVGGQPPGVQIRPPNYEQWKRRCVLQFDTTAQKEADWEDYLRSQIDRPYDGADILGLIIGKPLMSAGHWICSALQLEAQRRIDVIPDLGVTDQQCPPNMLYVACRAVGFRTT
jgi:hypothetical protein